MTSELNFEEQVASTQHKHQEGRPRRGNGRQKHSAGGKELMAQCRWSKGSKTDVAEGRGSVSSPKRGGADMGRRGKARRRFTALQAAHLSGNEAPAKLPHPESPCVVIISHPAA